MQQVRVRIVESADSEKFCDKIRDIMNQNDNGGYKTEVSYHPVVVHDESEYILYTALLIGRK